MTTPILLNHDPSRPIGVVEEIDGQLHVRFTTDLRITREIAFQIFGDVGLQVLEWVDDSDAMVIRRGRILEWSLPQVDPGRFMSDAESEHALERLRNTSPLASRAQSGDAPMEPAVPRQRTQVEVAYFTHWPGQGHKLSHKYREEWEPEDLFCPRCGQKAVWRCASGGDYYVGEQFLCTACRGSFYLPHGVTDSRGDQDEQRLRALAK